MADNLDMYMIEETGEMVFSAHFLQKKGRCCKSTCLHCPFGHTLQKIDIEFRENNIDQKILEKTLIENEYNKPSSVADQLLASNLGNKRKTLDLSKIDSNDIRIMYLKNYIMGFVILKDKNIDKIFLSKHFQFQHIDMNLVQDHFFRSTSAL